MFLKKYRQDRVKRLDKKMYNRGYDFAAGALLRGEETPLSIESHYCICDWTSFDRGVNDAVATLIEKGVVEDNSY